MRRTDREITDAEKITQIIQTCHCCRLGFCDNGAVYIVPLNFGYAEENGKRVFYFHSAKSGRKLDLIAGIPPGFKALSARGAFPLWRRPRRKKRLCRL